MKNTTVNNIRLGIFITTSIVLFVAAVYFIGKKQQLFSNTFQVSCIFKDISGLQVGNNVRFSGIDVGIVQNIYLLTDSSVKVDMVINADTRKFMKTNAKAIIGSDGLMGNKILLIIPGHASDTVIADNAMLETKQAVNLDDILINVKESTENSARITGDLAIIMHSIRNGRGTIGKLIMDRKLARNVDKALNNIEEGAGGFKENMNAASGSFFLKGYFKKKAKAKEEKLRLKKEKEEELKEQKKRNRQ
jgi:phospholipid/cholesterol/gamma-HCH transport system substrate-binding protein